MHHCGRYIAGRNSAGRAGRSGLSPYINFNFVLIACLTLTWLGASGPAFAQNAQVAGYVRDAQSRSVREAEISLVNNATADRRTAKTNDAGLYVFGSVAPGTYSLVTTADGFQTTTTPSLVVEVGQSLQVNVRLAVAGVEESVSVNADTVRIGSRDGSVGTTIDQAAIKTMPLSGGTFQALLELSPGVVNFAAQSGSYVVNGQRADSSSFSVDGVSANVGVNANTVLDSTGAGQSAGTTITGGYNGLVSLSALKEFRIQTSTFSPEFGRTPGAHVSVVSQSGSNTRTGEGFLKMRDEAFDANDWFANRTGIETPPLRQALFGGAVGGPLVHSRLFHFVSYERLRLSQPTVLNTTVPTMSARARASSFTKSLLEALPAPTGPDLTANDAEFITGVSDVRHSDALSIRLDTATRLFPQLFGRYNEAPSDSTNDRITTQNRTARRLRTVTLGATFAPTSRWLVDARFNYTKNRVEASAEGPFKPSQIVPDSMGYYLIGLTASNGLNFTGGNTYASSQTQWNTVASVSTMVGAHHLKGGVDYRLLGPSVERPLNSMTGTFNTTADAIAGRVSTFAIFNSLGTGASFSSFGAYVQDTWRPTARASLTYGARLEIAPSPSFQEQSSPPVAVNYGDIAALDLTFRPDGLWRTRYSNFAPRIGGSYQLDSNGRFVVRGGTGIFYDLGQQGVSPLLAGATFPNTTTLLLMNYMLPLSPQDAAGLPVGVTPVPPYSSSMTFVDPNLRMPYTAQWNVALEHALTTSDTIEVAYVGAAGHRLLLTSSYRAPNPRFTGQVNTIGNEGRSEYNALQLQYRRRLSSGLMARGAYTYSRSYDNSSDTLSPRAPSGAALINDWALSDFDVAHSASGAVSWMPSVGGPALVKGILNDWTIGLLGRVRSGTPLTVVVGRDSFGLGSTAYERPDVVPGEPFYIDDPLAPGGRRLNRAAFSTPPLRQQGNLPRNGIRAFRVSQFDLSLARSIPMRGARVDLRIDAFNVFNTPMFSLGVANPSLASATFGQSTGMLNRARATSSGDRLNSLYQMGGPRSIEMSVSYRF